MSSRRKALRERNIVSVGRILPRIGGLLVKKASDNSGEPAGPAPILEFPRREARKSIQIAQKASSKLVIASYHSSRPQLASEKEGSFLNNREGRKAPKSGKVVCLRIVRS